MALIDCPGVIGIPTGITARYTDFYRSLLRLERPRQTGIVTSTGAGIAHNRNEIVRRFLGMENARWLWMIDDDHVFHHDCLVRLLKLEKDIVVPLVVGREPPHRTVIYDGYRRDAKVHGFHTRLLKPEDGGQLELVAAGTAGMLCRREVFERLQDPWFEVGQFSSEELSEDLWFCKKAREAGFRVWVDFETQLGHLTPCAVWPSRGPDGAWVTGYNLGSAQMPWVPACREGEEGGA